MLASQKITLAGTAPAIEQDGHNLTVPFETYAVWSKKDVKTVFGVGDTSSVTAGARGPSTFSWNTLEDNISEQRKLGSISTEIIKFISYQV